MNTYFKFALALTWSAIICTSANAAPVIEKTLSVNGKKWIILIDVAPSKPHGNGQGYCGAGEEVILKIQSYSSKKIMFSKVIESCLWSIELQDGELGNETAGSLSKAIQLEKNPLQIRWSNIDGKSRTIGKIDLSSGKPVYSEALTSL